ncbi:MAG: lytic murein transglycosylase [Pararhodobacter sp.]
MTHRAGLHWLIAGIFLNATTLAAGASVLRSPFPVARPGDTPQTLEIARAAVSPDRSDLRAFAPARSLHPAARPRGIGSRAAQSTTRATAPTGAYGRWLSGFRGRALSEGISARVFDRTFADVIPNREVLQNERSQPEFSRPIWAYLDSAVSDSRIRDGQRMLREHRRILDEIETRYNVDREVVVAIWGMESAYGRLRGRTEIIPALTALAMESRRSRFYEQQLIGALQILQAGDVGLHQMTGSWAGAMGHTQFIPTSYLAYAVDFRGDGRRDIWSDDPTDSLASTAAYLARHGWQRGQPWGVEVRIPRGFNPRLANTSRDVREWLSLGVVAQRGQSLPSSGEATLMFPAGSQGPALLTFRNFQVIKRYNNADAYAIGVGHLADRLRGAGGFVASWPRDDRPLSRSEREELQRLLARAGLYRGEIDGRVGSGTLSAVRDWQAANGLPPDGYVSLALLQRMRR